MKPLSENQSGTRFFETMAAKVIAATGSAWAFFLALAVIIIWGVTGPVFHYSDTWQLVINTGTTIITFLMVFIIQKSQNKDSKSIQLKLNELIAAHQLASNRLIDVENLSEEELDVLHKYYHVMAEETKKRIKMNESHSVEEAIDGALSKHEEQLRRRKKYPEGGGSGETKPLAR
ncbi:low affinity iron permease family protein [Chitinophaga varians]|uniref:Low affinity iron permease family protein n=1 Tax=Chitinophaga varians TaxID=2202339 RepID=A0A847RTK7_9BACT|nr:low affinity iron permease family protein [Chitinophaga varians]NLR65184.1 low affinity iron permease family protein [Chitinophaga varians]